MGNHLSSSKLLGWVLVIALAVLALAFRNARARYEKRLRQQIWATRAPEVSAVASPAGLSLPTVMLLGDSRIEQWHLPAFRHWRVVNAGKGGLTTGQLRLATPRLLEEYHPDVLVVEAGINDLKYLGLQPGLAATMVSLAASNLTAIAQEGLKRHCRVLVLETWPAGQPSWSRRLVWSSAVPASVSELNAALQKLSAPGDMLRVVDLFHEAGLNWGPELYSDTLHFKPQVYQQLAPALGGLLERAPFKPANDPSRGRRRSSGKHPEPAQNGRD